MISGFYLILSPFSWYFDFTKAFSSFSAACASTGISFVSYELRNCLQNTEIFWDSGLDQWKLFEYIKSHGILYILEKVIILYILKKHFMLSPVGDGNIPGPGRWGLRILQWKRWNKDTAWKKSAENKRFIYQKIKVFNVKAEKKPF